MGRCVKPAVSVVGLAVGSAEGSALGSRVPPASVGAADGDRVRPVVSVVGLAVPPVAVVGAADGTSAGTAARMGA